jgi:hypothetical protein
MASISDGLRSFQDADTGEPLIEEIVESSEVFPSGERSERLPDIIVRWSAGSGAIHRAIESPQFGRIERATPGRIPNGRSGNHAPQGFLIARGPGIAAGGSLDAAADILDLAPTALRRLGVHTRLPLAGTPLRQLL